MMWPLLNPLRSSDSGCQLVSPDGPPLNSYLSFVFLASAVNDYSENIFGVRSYPASGAGNRAVTHYVLQMAILDLVIHPVEFGTLRFPCQVCSSRGCRAIRFLDTSPESRTSEADWKRGSTEE